MKSIQQLVHDALKAVGDYQRAINELRTQLKRKSYETVRATLLPHVASKLGCPVVDGKGKAQGTKVLDSTSKNYEACRKALNRLSSDIAGIQSNSSTEKVAVPKRVLTDVLDVIFDAGLTRDQFNALLAEVKASVAFE